MKLLCFCVFILAPSLLWATQEPAGCWKQKNVFPCAYRVENPQWLEREGFKVFLGRNSSLLLTNKKEWQILEGKVWVQNSNGWVLSQLGRQFHIQGEAWIEKQPEKLWLQHFRGETRIEGRIIGGVVPEGFQNWWTLAGEGIIDPMPASVLTEWNRWGRWPRKVAEKNIRDYKILWEDRLEESTLLYQNVIQRRISSAEDREDAAYQRKLKAQYERNRMRKMFRDRYESR